MPREITQQPEIFGELIDDYMAEHHRSWSIDTLLSHPTDAFLFGLHVAAKLGRIPHARAKRIGGLIEHIHDHFGAEVSAIQSVCISAINLRKRSKLRRVGKAGN